MSATAVIVVHGVVPHPPYDMQDQCARNLASELNAPLSGPAFRGASGDPLWACDVWEPPNAGASTTWQPLRSVTRVYQRPQGSETADAPSGDFYDVIEAYWSPLDKGKTSASRVITWMLRSVFAPLNTTARYVARSGKKRFDLWYLGMALGFALVLFALFAFAAVFSLAAIATQKISLSAAMGVLIDPTKLPALLSGPIVVCVAVGFIGAFLFFQGVKTAIWLRMNWTAFGSNDRQRWSRVISTAILLLVGAALDALAGLVVGASAVVYFALSGAAFLAWRTLLQSFFVNFFGDVEIYTTHDQNSDFYALREAILTTVTSTIGQAMSIRDGNKRRYDRVIILAHSLGSTIAMDALIRLYTLTEQTKFVNGDIADDFASIRAFVTFGTSLEKTRYFFDVYRPSMSEAALQFENDQYGVLFTDSLAVLARPNAHGQGIFWTNLWYEQDPVANEILSYVSFLQPGESVSIGTKVRYDLRKHAVAGKGIVGQEICYNQRGWQKMALWPLDHICIHGLYLDDTWFWRSDPRGNTANPKGHIGVLEIVTTKAAPLGARALANAPMPPTPRVPYRLQPLNDILDPRARAR